MGIPLRVVIVEDREDDAHLMVEELQETGFTVEWERVDSEPAFRDRLAAQPELILADYTLPQFSGLRALQILRERGLDIPFILVSGSIGEDAAIAAMKEGADDYLLKDRLARLGPAVEHALEQKRLRDEKRRAEQTLRESEQRFRSLFTTSPDAILLIDPHASHISWPIVDCNEAACRMNGYPRAELIGQSVDILNLAPATREERSAYLDRLRREGVIHVEAFHRHKDGHVFPIEVSTSLFTVEGHELVLGIDRDITGRKQAEEEIRRRAAHQSALNSIITAATQTGTSLNDLLETALDRILRAFGLEMGAIWMETGEQALHGLPPDFLTIIDQTARAQGIVITRVAATRDWQQVPGDSPVAALAGVMAHFGIRADIVAPLWRDEQLIGGLSVSAAQPREWSQDEIALLEAIGRQLGIIAGRKQAEEALRRSEVRFRALIENSSDVIALLGADANLAYVSPSLTPIFGYTAEEVVGHNAFELIHPDDQEATAAKLAELLEEPSRVLNAVYRIRHKNGAWRWVEATGSNLLSEPGLQAVVVNFRDITERKRAEAERLALLEILEGLAVTADLPAFLGLVHHSLAKVIDAENFFVVLYNKDTGLFEEVYAVDKYDPPAPPSKLEKSLSAYIFRTGEQLLMTQARFEALAAQGEVELVGTDSPSWLGVPLKTSTETIGVMVVQHYTDPNRYSEHDQNFLASIAGEVALAIERMRVEEALQESERRERERAAELQTIMDTVPAAVMIAHDPLGQVLTGNRASYGQLRLVPFTNPSLTAAEDQRPTHYQVRHNGVELPPHELPLQVAAATGVEITDFEAEVVFDDGAIAYTLGNVSPLFDELGRPRGAVGVFVDITERKQAEEALRASEERFRRLFTEMLDGFALHEIICDDQGTPTDYRFLAVNPAFEKLTGLAANKIIGKTARQVLPGLESYWIEIYGRVALTGEPAHFANYARELNRYFEVTAFSPQPGQFVALFADVTERKRAEEALRSAEASYRGLFEGMPIGLYRSTEQGHILDANEALVRLLHYPDRETLLAINAGDLFVDLEDRWREQELLKHAGLVHAFETRLRRYDGTIIWVEDNVRLIHDQAGLYAYYEGSLQDINDRKVRERELEAIASVSAALRAARTRSEMLSIALDQINELLIVDGASIAMRDPVTDEAVFEVGRGTGEDYVGRRTPPGAGVIGHVIATGRTYITNDARHDPTFLWPHLLGALQAVACIPLIVQDQTIGALWLGRVTAITNAELRILDSIASIAGSAIHRAALFEAERKQRVLAESLRDTASALSSSLDFDQVLDHILTGAQHVVPHDYARVMLIEGEAAYVVRSQGYAPTTMTQWIEIDSRPDLRQIQATGRALIIPDTQHYEDWPALPEMAWIRSYAGIPIRVRGQVIGFLVMHSGTPGFFLLADSERMQAFADQAAVAIDNARLYKEISNYAEELERRVAERTRDLTEANQRLQELDRLKSKFVSDVSHELRSPVTSLRLYVDLLENAGPEKRDRYLKVLQTQATRLSQLVEDILNLSRLEMGSARVQFEPVDLNALLTSIVLAHQPSAEAAGLDLTFRPQGDLPPVWGEQNQLAQVLTNLVANAINYTPRGQVLIRTDRQNDHVCLEVQDTGMGIDPEDVPHLFDRFYRGQQATKSKVRGTGLGLAIVKEIVDLHGGAIEVESQVGQGSTFRVCLPVADTVSRDSSRSEGVGT